MQKEKNFPSFYLHFWLMFFRLTGIKDISEKNYTLELLIEGHDIVSVKNFLSEQKVIVLGLEHYTRDPRDF